MTDPYVDPGTGVLRNKLGLKTQAELDDAEARIVSALDVALARKPLPGLFDYPHLKAIHAYLFDPMYDWAGQQRTVNIAKGSTQFCLTEHLASYSVEVFGTVSRYLRSGRQTKDDASGALARILGDINALHPFREGNGRAQRAFVRHLAGATGHSLSWAGVDADENVAASIAAMTMSYEPLTALIRQHLH